MIIAIIALLAAATSTAGAGGVLTTKKFKKQSVRGPLTYVTTTTPLPFAGLDTINVAAACPAGRRVIGGGIKVGNDEVSHVGDSHPTAAGWGGTAVNASGATNDIATTTAICARVKKVEGEPPAS